MKISNLAPKEKRELVAQYESAIRKLEFQLEKTRETLNELEASLPGGSSSAGRPKKKRGRPPKKKTEAKKPAKRRGRPPKAKSEKATTTKKRKRRGRPPKSASKATAKSTKTTKKRGRGRPPKKAKAVAKARKSDKGYRLSDWDEFIIAAVAEEGKPLLTKDFRDKVEGKTALTKGMSDAQIKAKIASCLHKLANKRDALKKVDHEGRGFAYALPEWVTNRGNLRPKYK